MTAKQAIKILKRHQKWRRGADIKMLDPADIGEAIDIVIILAGYYMDIYNLDRCQVKTDELNK